MASLFESRKKGRRDPADAVYLDELQPPAKNRRLITDEHKSAPAGFCLRMTAGGKQTFCLRYWREDDGRERIVSIGDYPTWTLAAARDQANEWRRQIDTGEDLAQQREDRRAADTVRQVTEEFCRLRVDHLASARSVRTMLERHLLAQLGDEKMPAIRRRDILALVEDIAATRRREAGRLLTYIKRIWAFAEDREIIEGNPVASLKAGNIGGGLTPRQRGRVLSNDELRAFWHNVHTSGMTRLTALALRLILVTGQRPGEVAGMSWSEISGDVWTIPADRRGKTESAHTVPLTDTALALLDDARQEVERLSQRRPRGPCGYVFENRIGACPSVNALARAVKDKAEALGNDGTNTEGHWRPHDLRRTMRTGLAAAGIGETVAESAIGHTRKGIAAVYDLHRYDAEKRAALEAWERRLLQIVTGQPVGNVVTIQGAK